MADEPHERAFKLLIEEYKSLRDEIGRFQNQQKQLIAAGIAGLGVIGAALLKDPPHIADYADFFLLGPLFFGSISLLFFEAEAGIIRAGYYTGVELRRRAKVLCNGDQGILEWEKFRADHEVTLSKVTKHAQPNFSSFILPKLLLFVLPSFFCFFLFYFQHSPKHNASVPHRLIEAILLLTGIVIAITCLFSFLKVLREDTILNTDAMASDPPELLTAMAAPIQHLQVGAASLNPPPPQGPNVDLYSVFREYIKHEDDLINNRLSWNLTIQGFLFGAYYFSLQKIADIKIGMSQNTIDNPRLVVNNLLHTIHDLKLFLVVVALVGAGVSLATYASVWAARAAIQNLNTLWAPKKELYRPPNVAAEDLPALVGGGLRIAYIVGFLAATVMPVVCFIAWCFLGKDAVIDLYWF